MFRSFEFGDFSFKLSLVPFVISKARVKRRTPHEPNRMQMRKTLCSPSLSFTSIRFGSCEVRHLSPALIALIFLLFSFLPSFRPSFIYSFVRLFVRLFARLLNRWFVR